MFFSCSSSKNVNLMFVFERGEREEKQKKGRTQPTPTRTTRTTRKMGGEENKKTTALRTDLGLLTCHNINQLKMLNSLLFPVEYPSSFYDELLKKHELTKLAYYNGDHVCGAVSCKEVVEDGVKKIYIMTLGVLPAYRHRGVGHALVDFVLNKVCKSRPDVKQVCLHVQTNNEVAINFYKKLGFEIGDVIENYYKDVEPSSCHLVYKDL